MKPRRRHPFWGLLLCTMLLAVATSLPAQQPGAGAEPPDDGAAAATVGESAADSATAGESAAGVNRAEYFRQVVLPLIILGIGIAIVLGLIIVFRINAFIALISAAMVVSLMAPGEVSEKIGRVAVAFGGTAGGIAIVIALASVIGKCMLDSGAADRIVRAFVGLMGEKRASFALMGSGYVLAIPVFFDTVFYLLVPLARSLHRRTHVQYLKYILAIGAGGALTHSLVPPTPGPLLMASTLNVDLGWMIMVGAAVALPAAVVGVIFADLADRIMKTPMRSLSGEPEPDPLEDEKLPPLAIAVLPVLLPVILISANTILTTYADAEGTARLKASDVRDWSLLEQRLLDAGRALESAGGSARTPLERLWQVLPADTRQLLIANPPPPDETVQNHLLATLNEVLSRKDFYQEQAFVGAALSGDTGKLLRQDRTRMPQAVQERLNRLLLEDALRSDDVLVPHQWLTLRRKAANISEVFGNANFALLISTVIAMWMLVRQRGLSRQEMARVVETSLMSGGVIILITSGGGAFGKMLQAAEIGPAIERLFGDLLQGGGGGGLAYLFLGFLLASVLKIAQGSGTVAMIVGSSMMAALIDPQQLSYSPVYLATAIGAGSLMGSWMNDSGFWIFAKMGGLTETEALKSWTLMLVVLGLTSFLVTLLLATLLPLKFAP